MKKKCPRCKMLKLKDNGQMEVGLTQLTAKNVRNIIIK